MRFKKRILFINGHLNAGGVERSLVDILKHMDYTKYAVDLLLLEDTGDYASELPSEVKVLFRDIHHTYGSFASSIRRCIVAHDWMCLRLRFLFLLQKFFGACALKRVATILLGKHHYDCVIGFRPGICSDLAAYSVQTDRKITWWHHGEFNVDCATYGNMCSKMNAVAVVSQSCKAMLQEKLSELESKLVCIPNMLDAVAIGQKAGNSPYTGDMLHIVSVGRLAPEKHFENIIPVAKMLRDMSTDFVWHIVGDGSEQARLESLIVENDLKDHVILDGSKTNPYPYMKYADLFVHPSYVESQGLTVLEAMALGVPCVVTKSRGPCEYIEDGVNGLLTEQSPESLAEEVLAILNDKKLYQHIKENTKCPEQFGPERVIKQIETMIDGEM
ncbi:MAG: glycosyltransferase [Firmicutes bacterium]|nr:glycosyltransferase [Bacillota bacterium]